MGNFGKNANKELVMKENKRSQKEEGSLSKNLGNIFKKLDYYQILSFFAISESIPTNPVISVTQSMQKNANLGHTYENRMIDDYLD